MAFSGNGGKLMSRGFLGLDAEECLRLIPVFVHFVSDPQHVYNFVTGVLCLSGRVGMETRPFL